MPATLVWQPLSTVRVKPSPSAPTHGCQRFIFMIRYPPRFRVSVEPHSPPGMSLSRDQARPRKCSSYLIGQSFGKNVLDLRNGWVII